MQGAISGVVLASGYSIIFIIGRFIFLYDLAAESLSPEFLMLALAIILLSGMIGAFTGWILTSLIESLKARITKSIAIALGSLICLIIAAPIQIFGLGLFSPFNDSFWFFTSWYTIPGIIYMTSGGWFAGRIYSEIDRTGKGEIEIQGYIDF